jgi:hypothetical protein
MESDARMVVPLSFAALWAPVIVIQGFGKSLIKKPFWPTVGLSWWFSRGNGQGHDQKVVDHLH